MSDLDSLLDQRKMPTEDVRICLDLNLLAERDRAMADVNREYAKTKNDDRMVSNTAALNKARETVADVEARIREKSFLIRVTGVDRTRYNQFMLECPPRKGKAEPFDTSKFYMHVARKTGVYVDREGAEHEISAAQWERIDKTITDGEHDRIAKAVIEVNRSAGGQDVAFLGDDSETTPDSSETSD
jgi:hypothetical protein